MMPNTYRGTNDFIGKDYQERKLVSDVIAQVYKNFGYQFIETPILETDETLRGKGTSVENVFWLSSTRRGGLRFDHTVPLARYMAMNPQLTLPFKRAVIGPVFRKETTQRGRFTQFVQCDIDTVGSSLPMVDAEVIAVNYAVLVSLGFTDQYVIRVNDRRLLNAMVSSLGIDDPDQRDAVFRAWDKLEKASRQQISDELEAAGIYGDMLTSVNSLTDFLEELCGRSAAYVEKRIRGYFKGKEAVRISLQEIMKIFKYAFAMRVPAERLSFWPLLARGLDYYTGFISEIVVAEQNIGSIGGGGRFDNLIEALGGPSLPACGSSFGLERLVFVMEQLGLLPEKFEGTQIFVTVFDPDDDDLCQETFCLAQDLRLTGYDVELYTGDQPKLSTQLKAAARKDIPIVIILGPDEYRCGVVTVKDMNRRQQKNVMREELLAYLQEIL